MCTWMKPLRVEGPKFGADLMRPHAEAEDVPSLPSALLLHGPQPFRALSSRTPLGHPRACGQERRPLRVLRLMTGHDLPDGKPQ